MRFLTNHQTFLVFTSVVVQRERRGEKRKKVLVVNRAERRRITREQARQDKKARKQAARYGRVVASDYTPSSENAVFSFLINQGVGETAFEIARREADADSIGAANRYWLLIFECLVNGTARALDELGGSVSALTIATGWRRLLQQDYDDAMECEFVLLSAVVVGMCVAELQELGFCVESDEDGSMVYVYSPMAA